MFDVEYTRTISMKSILCNFMQHAYWVILWYFMVNHNYLFDGGEKGC